jgi:hypothetical protein
MTELINLMLELRQRDPEHVKYNDDLAYRSVLTQACQSRGWDYITSYTKSIYHGHIYVPQDQDYPLQFSDHNDHSETLAFARAYKAALESIKPTWNAKTISQIHEVPNGFAAIQLKKLIATRDIRAGEEIITE